MISMPSLPSSNSQNIAIKSHQGSLKDLTSQKTAKKWHFVTLPEESFSSYSHMVGALISFLGTILLLLLSPASLLNYGIILLYGISITFLFGISSLYHAHKEKENEISVWRKMDHIAIFVMIAGTYTPLSVIYLPNNWTWIILGSQWGLVFIGTILKLWILNSPRWITTGIYLIQGWMALFPVFHLYHSMPLGSFLLLFFGGISFSIGAVIYSLKKPNPYPGLFGFHEIFHVMIMIGAFLHYLVIFRAYLP